MAHGSIGAHDNFLPNIIQTACQVIRLPEFGPSSWWMVGQEILINELVFELIYSEGDHNHTLGEIEKCLIDVDLRPSLRGPENIFFCFTAYTETGWKGEAM
jgi:hypothetical protein